MTGFEVKGWCPSALRPMMSGDGLIVRVHPRMARLSKVQARGLAQAATRYGNGLIDISARANIQLRGIRDGRHADLLADLTTLGLLDYAGPNVVVSPYWVTGDGTQAVYEALTTRLSAPDAPLLPDKFGFAIGLSAKSVLHRTSADIRIEWHPDGILVRPDSFAVGAVMQSPADAAIAAITLSRWFVAMGGAKGGRGRMAGLWPDADTLERQARLPEKFQTGAVRIGEGDRTVPGPHAMGMLVGLEFGQIDAETFATLAQHPLRVTPWRMILLEGVAKAPDLPGLISDAADPRLRVTACTGATGCPQGLQPTRPRARQLADQVPAGQHLHVSGCAKGCAHPGPADMTLVANRDGFAVIRDGRASDLPVATFDPLTPLFKVL